MTAHARMQTVHASAEADAAGYTLTVEAAATQLARSPDTIRRYIRAGKLPALRIEGLYTFGYRLTP